jgi:two-component system response regulator PilR (NtrC family)
MNKDLRLLVVDDEESMREFLRLMFEKEGYIVFTADSSEKAMEFFNEEIFDLVVSDIQLGRGMNGMELLKQIKKISPETIFLMVTAYATLETAIEAFREGAWDYILKPFDINEIKIKIANALEKRSLELEVIRLRRELSEKYRYQNIIGKNEKMLRIFDLIERVAPTDAAVLVTGESGTGKDLVARAIHYSSHRKNHSFVFINCPAMPEQLLESELFGHTKGSFTGAIRDKEGLLEQANNGTVFLDEIGEMPLQMQVKLLNVLQDKKFRRVGGNKEISSNFRLITATNRKLQAAVENGKFREDLWYRINVIQIDMPPLRERLDDIPLLINYFLLKFREQTSKKIKGIDPVSIKALESYNWPGNVRELENAIERAVTLETTDQITLDSLPDKITQHFNNGGAVQVDEKGFDLESHIENEYRKYLAAALLQANGVQTRAAQYLKMPVRSFRYLIDKYDIKVEEK